MSEPCGAQLPPITERGWACDGRNLVQLGDQLVGGRPLVMRADLVDDWYTTMDIKRSDFPPGERLPDFADHIHLMFTETAE